MLSSHGGGHVTVAPLRSVDVSVSVRRAAGRVVERRWTMAPGTATVVGRRTALWAAGCAMRPIPRCSSRSIAATLIRTTWAPATAGCQRRRTPKMRPAWSSPRSWPTCRGSATEGALCSWLFAIAQQRRPPTGLTELATYVVLAAAAEAAGTPRERRSDSLDDDELQLLLGTASSGAGPDPRTALGRSDSSDIVWSWTRATAAVKVSQFRAYARLRQIFGPKDQEIGGRG